MYPSRPSVVVLSRGSTWNPRFWDPPYTMPDDVVGGAWPAGATAQAIFYDNAGGVLGVVDGTVSPGGITFNGVPAVVDLVPNGANFEIFLTTSGAVPYQIRYGKVIRREVEFLLSTTPAAVGQLFSDSWPTTGIRSQWRQVALTNAVVHDNSGLSLANGIGSPNTGSQSDNAIRWFQPLDGDSVKVKITCLNRHPYANSTFARMRVIVCSDVAMTNYLSAELLASANITGTHIDQVQFATGTAPTAVTYQGSPASHVLANGESITVGFDEGSNTISVYSGTNLTPLASWTDSTNIVAHGPGHRYLALAWSTSPSSDGLQATTWQASDEL